MRGLPPRLVVIMQAGGRERRRLGDEAYEAGHCFLLTACTRGRRRWFTYGPVARAACVIIEASSIELGQRLWAYCLMPDHLHLLISGGDPRDGIRLIKGRVSALARRHDVRSLWQRSFHDHAVRPGDPARALARYTLDNPVRAGLSRSPAHYPYSGSLTWPEWHGWFACAGVNPAPTSPPEVGGDPARNRVRV